MDKDRKFQVGQGPEERSCFRQLKDLVGHDASESNPNLASSRDISPIQVTRNSWVTCVLGNLQVAADSQLITDPKLIQELTDLKEKYISGRHHQNAYTPEDIATLSRFTHKIVR